jgi:hypothetical protein
MSTYDRLKNEYLPALKPIFEADGFQVFNCNPGSELKVFPFVSFEDAIKEATSKLGDVDTERSWGMYSKPEEKMQWAKEPSEEQKGHLKLLKQLKGETVSQTITSTPVIQNGNTVEMPVNPLVNDGMSTCQSITLKDN